MVLALILLAYLFSCFLCIVVNLFLFYKYCKKYKTTFVIGDAIGYVLVSFVPFIGTITICKTLCELYVSFSTIEDYINKKIHNE